MRFSIAVNGQDVGSYSLIRLFSLTRESGGKMTTCQLGLFNVNGILDDIVVPGADVLISQVTSPTGALFDESLFDEVMFGENQSEGGGVAYFRGYAAEISPERWNNTTKLLSVTCQDSTILLDTLMVTGKNYTSATGDDDIITEIFGELAPEINLAEVSFVASIPTLKLEGVSLRRAMEMICALTGAEWSLTPDNVLRYYTPSAATLFFSDDPDDVNIFGYNIKRMKYSEDFRTPANSVRVYGALKSGTTRYTGLAENTASQTTFKRIFHRTITDNGIKSDAQALLRAQVEVARYAYPEASGTIEFLRDGVDVGKKIGIVNAVFGVDDEFLVRKLTIKQASPTVTFYTADFGAIRPDVIALLRKLTAMAEPAAEATTAVPGPASVGNSSLDRSTADKFQVTTGDIAALAVTGAKIAAATISGSHIQNLTIKSNNIEDAAIIASKIQTAAIASSHLQNLCVATDKLDNLAVTAAKIANAAVGTDQLANLSVTAAKIVAGTITATQIANLTITADLIANLTITAGKIADATITSAKIYDLAISKLTGWDGGTINVGTGGLTLTSAGGLIIGSGSGIIAGGFLIMDSHRNVSNVNDLLVWGKIKQVAFSEAIDLSTITTVYYFVAYDTAGNYIGKIPIVPA